MQQTMSEQIGNMTKVELLSLSEQIYDELNKRNTRGLEYGQKVLMINTRVTLKRPLD